MVLKNPKSSNFGIFFLQVFKRQKLIWKNKTLTSKNFESLGKLLEEISTYTVGNHPLKSKFGKFFFIEFNVILRHRAALEWPFLIYEPKVMRHVLFLEHFKQKLIFKIKPIHIHIHGLQILRKFQICQYFDDTPMRSEDMHVLRFFQC